MHPARMILIAVVAGTFVPEARAISAVWWEATPLNASSSVTNMGLGQNLDLSCAGSRAVCEWDVTMFLFNGETIYGWGSDLAASDPALHVTGFQYESWWPTQGVHYPFDNVNSGTTVNGGIHDAFAFTLTNNGAPASQSNYYQNGYPLFSFTLRGDSLPLGYTHMTTFTNAAQWGGMNPEVWVQFGGNPLINAAQTGVGPAGPVISVFVPEPATAALVGVAVICLARRVRRQKPRRPRASPLPNQQA